MFKILHTELRFRLLRRSLLLGSILIDSQPVSSKISAVKTINRWALLSILLSFWGINFSQGAILVKKRSHLKICTILAHSVADRTETSWAKLRDQIPIKVPPHEVLEKIQKQLLDLLVVQDSELADFKAIRERVSQWPYNSDLLVNYINSTLELISYLHQPASTKTLYWAANSLFGVASAFPKHPNWEILRLALEEHFIGSAKKNPFPENWTEGGLDNHSWKNFAENDRNLGVFNIKNSARKIEVGKNASFARNLVMVFELNVISAVARDKEAPSHPEAARLLIDYGLSLYAHKLEANPGDIAQQLECPRQVAEYVLWVEANKQEDRLPSVLKPKYERLIKAWKIDTRIHKL